MNTAAPHEHHVHKGRLSPLTFLRSNRGLALAALTVLVALVLIVVGASYAERSGDVGLEAAKAGFGLLVLGFAGLGVTGALNWFAQRSDERRRVNEAALDLLRELIDSYNSMKSARRVLRALGLREPTQGRKLTPEQAQDFERQMRELVKVQLSFERVGREMNVRMAEDAQDAEESASPSKLKSPEANITRIESYVGLIVKEWEDHGSRIVAGGYDVAQIAALPRLKTFLKRAEGERSVFRTNTSDPLSVLERFFRDRLLVPFVLNKAPLVPVSTSRSATKLAAADGLRQSPDS